MFGRWKMDGHDPALSTGSKWAGLYLSFMDFVLLCIQLLRELDSQHNIKKNDIRVEKKQMLGVSYSFNVSMYMVHVSTFT
jgi:hypothetical protein